MPYDNPYNRRIANEVGSINNRFAQLYAYSPVDGRSNMSMGHNVGGYNVGGSTAGVLFQMGNASKRDGEDNLYNDEFQLPPVYYYGVDSEAMEGGNGFAEGTYRDRGDGHSMGASASGSYKKDDMMGMGMSGGESFEGGNLWTDIYDGFSDLGDDIGKATSYVFGSGKPEKEKMRALGRVLGHFMKKKGMGMSGGADMGAGMSGGSWWDSLKSGISDVVGFLPELAIHALGGKKARGRPKKVKKEEVKEVGGAILGNPDPYPVQGNSQRIAGRGRPKKMKGGAKEMDGKNGDLLAMPSVALANGVPPTSQLRGSYGGAKPKKVLKEVEKALKTAMKGKGKVAEKEVGGKNLSGMTDKRAEMSPPSMKGDGRKARAEIVKKIMKEKGMKMIEASKYVKEHNLYKK